MPDSLESYYQEAGRAGRDGKRAYAVLLVAPDDAERVQRRFDLQFPPLDEIRDIYEKVCSYLQIGIGDGEQASFVFNIHDFCAKFRLFGGKVASALKLLQQNGYLTLTDEMRNPARILFCISRDDLYKLRVVRNDLDHFIRTVLRLYDGVFTDFRPIDEQEIAAASGYKVEHVKELFKRLWQMRVIRYIPANQAPMLFFDCERLPAADLYIARRALLAHDRLRRQRNRVPQHSAGTLFRCGRPRAVRCLRHLSGGAQTREIGRSSARRGDPATARRRTARGQGAGSALPLRRRTGVGGRRTIAARR